MAVSSIASVHTVRADCPEDDSLARWRAGFPRLHLDLGCGDARFARGEALAAPDLAVVGIDTCLDNVRLPRRSPLPNLRLIKADARSIRALAAFGGADRITINFPHGSLLRWIVGDGEECLDALMSATGPETTLEIRINASGVREIGIAPGEVERRLWDAFARRGEWRAGLARWTGPRSGRFRRAGRAGSAMAGRPPRWRSLPTGSGDPPSAGPVMMQEAEARKAGPQGGSRAVSRANTLVCPSV